LVPATIMQEFCNPARDFPRRYADFLLDARAARRHAWRMTASPLARAVAAAGGPAAFMAAVGISPRTLATWRKEGVPDTRWRDVAACGGATPDELALERASKAPERAA
jgi:hypothetical protein